ncbi:uncharacterized membrane protein YhaH (DUF805 family) [Sinorhizobium terangae]|uniref:Uncharacterized protein n=1 Tax=Sinorhizobium terangae TaxID=110322 RepID=A0A6N7LBZ6_SINTE|nr:hypothetical protein [Sinorhizobium terangae]MBB4188278.1 uncharacterized membrane protein YhaH (DUF805 family) [Sinorhizobium terangae]MQX15371.1 hypothetical protein [Sinorhizobium terangae]
MGTLGAALSALLAVDVAAATSRYRRNAMLWAIIVTLLGTAYVFALVAVTLFLAERYSPVAAVATMAAVLFVTALILMAVMAGLRARDRRLAEERRRLAAMQTNLALVAAAGVLRTQPLLAVATAVAVGALLGLGKGRRHDEKS